LYNSNTFTYDGVSSTTLGLFLCKVGNADSEKIFVAERSIVNETLQKNGKTHNFFYKTEKRPLRFQADFFLDGTWSDYNAREVARFFFKDRYCEFVPDDTNRVYVCMPTGSSKMFSENTTGYFSLEFECIDEYSRSSLKELNYDYSTATTTQTFTFYNTGDATIYPIIEITNIDSNSTVTIANTTTGKTMKFDTVKPTTSPPPAGSNPNASGNPLIAGEIIVVDCDKEIVKTNQLGIYRYGDMVGDFLYFIRDVNSLSVTGKCRLKITYRMLYLI
jgi:phage-related protein